MPLILDGADQRIDKLVEAHRSKLEKLWGNQELKKPIVFLLQSRKDIDRIRDGKTDDRLVGWFWKDRFVFILHPDRFESDSCFSKNEFEHVLAHELFHYYFSTITGGSAAWLDEGMACAFAGQKYTAAKITKSHVQKMLECYFDFDRSLFAASTVTTESLVQHFGKKKLFTFLKDQKGRPRNPTDFRESFKKYFGFDDVEKEIRKLIKKERS